jgi:hypothetical protein
MRGITVVTKIVLRECESAKQSSIADASHLELDWSRTMGKRGLKHDFFAPWGKTPLEDHPEVASEAMKVIGRIHHHQIQWLGVRSTLIGKQGQPADISSIACNSRRVKGILIFQHWRSGLASVSST